MCVRQPRFHGYLLKPGSLNKYFRTLPLLVAERFFEKGKRQDLVLNYHTSCKNNACIIPLHLVSESSAMSINVICDSQMARPGGRETDLLAGRSATG